MKQLLLFICFTAITAFTTMQAQEVQRYRINVGDFTKLQIADNLNVTYSCNADSAGLVTFSGTEAEMRSFLFNNRKSTLKIQVSTDEALSALPMPHITVYSSSIKELENEADSTLYVENITTDGKLKLKLTDNGKIIARNLPAQELETKIFTGQGLIAVSGKCDMAKLRCTGTGKIEAYDLKATSVECMLLGTGRIECHVNGGRLVTKGSGPGRIYYTGTPSEIKSYHLGKLKIIPSSEPKPEDIPVPRDSTDNADKATEYFEI